MARISILIVAAAVVVLGGAAAFLATWDIPAPRAKVERVIPADRLGK